MGRASVGRALWVAHSARGSPASCRGAMASTPRESFLSRRSAFASLDSGRSSQLAPGRAARDAALHRAGTPNPLCLPASVGRASVGRALWVAHSARGSPASCRGAMASTPRESFLSRRSAFASLYSGRSSYPAPGRAARDAALHRARTPNPLCLPASVGRAPWVAHCGSRILREAPRHPAGERWLNASRIVPLAPECVRVS